MSKLYIIWDFLDDTPCTWLPVYTYTSEEEAREAKKDLNTEAHDCPWLVPWVHDWCDVVDSKFVSQKLVKYFGGDSCN